MIIIGNWRTMLLCLPLKIWARFNQYWGSLGLSFPAVFLRLYPRSPLLLRSPVTGREVDVSNVTATEAQTWALQQEESSWREEPCPADLLSGSTKLVSDPRPCSSNLSQVENLRSGPGTIIHPTSPMPSAMATSGTRTTTWELDTVLLTRDTQDVDTWTVLAPSHVMDARSLWRSHSFLYNFIWLLCCTTIE